MQAHPVRRVGTLPDLHGVLDEVIDSTRDRRAFDWKRAVAKRNGYRGRP